MTSAFKLIAPFSPRARKQMENIVMDLREALVEKEATLLDRVEKSLLDQITLREQLATTSREMGGTIQSLRTELAAALQVTAAQKADIERLTARVAAADAQLSANVTTIMNFTQEKADVVAQKDAEAAAAAAKHRDELVLLNNRYQAELYASSELRREKDGLTAEARALAATVATLEEALEATEKKLAKANAALKELKVCVCFFPVPPSTVAAR
jgi:DNA repair exonuclease SbcCD ATPase subunit